MQCRARRIGVLLVNLGTPDATDYWSMRRYLKEFLSDRRVIEENRFKWWLVLNLIILTVRPGRKGRDYDKIWNKQRDKSPLKTITRSQSDKLEEMLGEGRAGVSASTGRCATAIRRSARGLEALAGAGLRTHLDRAALSAICGGHHRDRVRRSLPRARAHALPAGVAGGGALLRRVRSISTRSPLRSTPSWPSFVQTGGDRRLIPRHAGGLCRQGRSLYMPLRRDHARCCASSSSSTKSG